MHVETAEIEWWRLVLVHTFTYSKVVTFYILKDHLMDSFLPPSHCFTRICPSLLIKGRSHVQIHCYSQTTKVEIASGRREGSREGGGDRSL